MNYFLDFGTHYFHGSMHENGILAFERRGFFGETECHEWKILTFEPSPHAYEANKQFISSIAARFRSFEAYNAAIGNTNGTIQFKWCPGNEAGSNCLGMMVPEVSEAGAKIYDVPVVDIKGVIEEIVSKDEKACIVIKCDIEGAEFLVLPRLLETMEAGRWVREIFVEWHERFWRGKPNYQEILDAKASIEKSCQEAGIVLHDWQ